MQLYQIADTRRGPMEAWQFQWTKLSLLNPRANVNRSVIRLVFSLVVLTLLLLMRTAATLVAMIPSVTRVVQL
jgi:hypothetical protein